MDERLKKALDFSNYMVTLNNQKRMLKEKYYEELVYYINGGQFTITQNLISFCQSLISLNQTEVVLIDDNDLPIEINNLDEFTINILNVYSSAANRYLNEYSMIKKSRTVMALADLNNE